MVSDDLSRSGPGSDYASVFRRYVVRGAEHALATIAETTAAMGADGQEQALHTLTYALDLPEAWPLARDLLVNLAPLLEQAGYRDNWQPYLEQGIDRCHSTGESAAEGELRLQLGVLHQLRGRLDEARATLQAALASPTSDTVRGLLLRNLGKVEAAQGDTAAARAHWQEASKLLPDDAELRSLLSN